MEINEVSKKLMQPFPASDVEWRVANTTKDKARGLAVPYIDSRAIQNRLDEVVGIYCWKTEYIQWHKLQEGFSQLCVLSIFDSGRREWIPKCDGAENTDFEPIKGGISDSFKRAAVLWGIGRYLYAMDGLWVEIEPMGKGYKIKASEGEKLNAFYEKSVKAIFGASPSKSISKVDAQHSDADVQNVIPFDYAVKKAQKQQFASGNGMILELVTPHKNKSVVAYLLKEDSNICEGVCLKNVSLSTVPSASGAKELTVLSGYQIAA